MKTIKFACFLGALLFWNGLIGQALNSDPTKSYINITMPKTPESQSFEKYGAIPVNEYSGTPNISIPIYNVKSRFLEAPISLSYHASGIKVNQEATWVGLGFDLMCAGRITVETKGNIDDNVRNITTQQFFKEGVSRLFYKWKKPYSPTPNASKLGYAFLDYGKAWGHTEPYWHSNDTAWDGNFTVTNSAWYGAGEPDIYHANFMGHSLSFYFDLLNDQIRFIGEKSLFNIHMNRDANNKISKFTIIDNGGVIYEFEQAEKTTVSVMPNFAFASSLESKSAFLLTKMIHPTGDTITFSYTNFGKTFPAFTWSASISMSFPYSATASVPFPQNQIEQEPYYLTKIESGHTTVDFILSSRDDLRGPGARKLERIDIKEKGTSNIIKQVQFTYDYFLTPLSDYENTLSPTISSFYGKRLRLLSMKEHNTTEARPWLFYYNPLQGPSKLSFAQDHWGFYNGAYAFSGFPDPTSPLNLIPRFENLGNLATRNISGHALYIDHNNDGCDDGQLSNPQIDESFNGYANNRNCSPTHMLAFTMDSIVYPTGGATKFEYEPHRSTYYEKNISDFVGGGLRIKSIKNYSWPGQVENSTEYDYGNSGFYLGAIEYVRISTKWPAGQTIVMSTSGELNADNLNVGYGKVTKIIKNHNNQANNGYEIKYYHVSNPLPVEYTSVSHPFPIPQDIRNTLDFTHLVKKWSGNAPMPRRDRDGKLYKEEILNKENKLVKSIEYFYRQADYNNDFYSIKAADNYPGHPGVLTFTQNVYRDGCSGEVVAATRDYGQGSEISVFRHWRRWELCLTPAVSFFTVLDSTRTKTYNDYDYITEVKSYKYNTYQQPEFTAVHNSDGTQTITYLKTPLSFVRPPVPSAGQGYGFMMDQLRNSHIYDLPIETVTIRRTATGDSLVVNGVFQVFEYTKLKEVHLLETATPLLFRSEFIPTYYLHNYPTLPSFDIVQDANYKLLQSATYNSNSLVKSTSSTGVEKAYIWDETYSSLLAECTNAAASDIAYSSFETNTKGNWSYTGTSIPEATAPTGSRAYNLTNGIISIGSLNAAKSYVVSYWSKSGAQGVNGTTAKTGRSFNGWTYYEHKVQNPGSGSISVSGTGTIDELRLYPTDAQMNTYTHKPLIGLASQCDVNNRISYYTYDTMGRLMLIKDMDGNIIQTLEYQFKQ